jgi:hypothetical protein
MNIFDFDDPTKSAEDKMSDAFGCVVLGFVGAVMAMAMLIWLVWRSL